MRSNIQDEGDEDYATSTTGFVEGIRSEPALHQHDGDHGGHEGNVPGRHPDRHGSGDGRGAWSRALRALGRAGGHPQKLPQRLHEEDRKNPAGRGGHQGAPGPERLL